MIIPEVRPRTGIDLANAVRVLREESDRVDSFSSGDAETRLQNFHRWASEAAEMLESILSVDDADRLVRTPRHDLLMGKATAYNQQLVNLTLNAEGAAQKKAFDALVEQFSAAAHASVEWPPTILVPDTNVYLHQEAYFDELPWGEMTVRPGGVLLLVPAAVLRELDQGKRANGQKKVSDTNPELVRTRARVTSRRIRDRFEAPGDVVELSANVHMELLLDRPGHPRAAFEDNEIIERAEAVQSMTGRAVFIVTGDGNMQFAAQVAGLSVVPLPD